MASSSFGSSSMYGVDMPAHTASAPPQTTASSRIPRACQACNRKKAKCSGNHPCDLCRRTSTLCEYVPAQKRGRKRKASPDGSVASPAAAMENGLHSDTKSVQGMPAISKSEEEAAESRSVTDDESPASFVKKLFRRDHGPHLTSFSQLVTDARQVDASGPLLSSHRQQHDAPLHQFLTSLHTQSPRTSPATAEHHQLQLAAGTSVNSTDPGSTAANSWANPGDTSVGLDWLSSETGTLHGTTTMFQDKSDNELEEFLYRDYWAIVHPLWPILYRPALNRHSIRRTRPLLHHAILAIAAAFRKPSTTQMPSPSNEVLSEEEKEKCSALGRQHLSAFQRSLDVHAKPALANAQALVLASFVQMSLATVYLARRYLGLAVGICMELGLHEPEDTLLPGSPGYADQQEARRLVWGCYIADRYLSLAVGKPSMMSGSSVKCGFPSTVESDDLILWSSDAAGIVPSSVCRDLENCRALTMTGFVAWTKLALILEEIMLVIYSDKSRSSRRDVKGLADLHEKLRRWTEDFPPALGSFEEDEATIRRPPHTVYLRMWLHTCRLILHRPFISRTPKFPLGNRQLTSYDLCMEAAESICKLTPCYSRSLGGLGRVSNACIFMVFQAGILFVANSTSEDADVSRHCSQRLQQCLGWMDEIGVSYAMTDRYREVLQALWDMSQKRARHPAQTSLPPLAASYHHNDLFLLESTANAGMEDVLPVPYDIPKTASIFDFGDTATNPVDHIHESFWDSMPLTGFNSAEWEIFTAQYDSIPE